MWNSPEQSKNVINLNCKPRAGTRALQKSNMCVCQADKMIQHPRDESEIEEVDVERHTLQ